MSANGSGRPKVAVVCAVYDQGGGYIENTLAEALTRYADVQVITSDVTSLPVGHTPARSSNELASDVRIQRLPALLNLRLRIVSKGVARALSRATPDVIIVLSPSQYFPLPAVHFAHRRSVPLVYFSGEHDGQGPSTGVSASIAKAYKAVVRRSIYKYAAGDAQIAFVVTPETKALVAGATGRKDIRLISLPVDERVFFQSGTVRERTRLDHRWDGTVCVFAGKFDPRKRIDELVGTWAESFPEGDAHLVLCGATAGEQTDRVVQKTKQLGVADRVTLLPFLNRTELNRIYNAADLALFPDPTIGIQQGLTTGLHVVTNPVPAVAHLQDLKLDGIHLRPVFDADALSDLVKSLGANTFDENARRERAEQAHAALSADAIAREIVGAVEDETSVDLGRRVNE